MNKHSCISSSNTMYTIITPSFFNNGNLFIWSRLSEKS